MNDAPLFERVGGRDGVRSVVEKTMANHMANPVIKTRFEHADQGFDELVEHATEFFCTGLSGVETYQGRPMSVVHGGMNVTDEEFCAVLDDILDAIDSVGIRNPERAELLEILYSMKPEVVKL